MSVPFHDPYQLWSMEPHAFNEWRASNDIPLLFDYFEKKLPFFSEWLTTLPIKREDALRVVPTAALLAGENSALLIERETGHVGHRRIEVFGVRDKSATAYWAARGKTAIVLGEFEPYIKWAKNKTKEERFIVSDALNHSKSDSFVFGLWTGNGPGVPSRAYLFKEFQVLKLGGVNLQGFINFGDRNLDFVDLDYTRIVGGNSASVWSNISFSSCRHINISNSEINFIRFRDCSIDKFTAERSRLQDIYFERSDVDNFILEAVKAYRLGFRGGRMTPYFNSTELRDFRFVPASHAPVAGLTTTYRLLRSAYQSVGMRREAAECYYKERIFERKSYFKPYLDYDNRDIFPSLPYGGSVLAVYRMIKSGDIPKAQWLGALRKAVEGRLKLWVKPKSFVSLVKFRVRWLVSLLEYLIWGYGERPGRILFVAAMTVGNYGVAYHSMDWSSEPTLDWVSSLYFSVVTFTTLGYGDITPKTTLLKVVCGSEALLGAFFMGLIVAGFSNRARY